MHTFEGACVHTSRAPQIIRHPSWTSFCSTGRQQARSYHNRRAFPWGVCVQFHQVSLGRGSPELLLGCRWGRCNVRSGAWGLTWLLWRSHAHGTLVSHSCNPNKSRRLHCPSAPSEEAQTSTTTETWTTYIRDLLSIHIWIYLSILLLLLLLFFRVPIVIWLMATAGY